MKYISLPKQTDNKINYNTWNSICNHIKRLINFKFDPTNFEVSESATGTFVRLRGTLGGGDELPAATTLYKVLAVREYDENGTIVAVGSETVPLPADHTYEWTEDWVRAH
jgi:hypothetical protein